MNWDSLVMERDSWFFTRWVPGLTITICNKITAECMSYKDVVFTESQIEGVKKGRGQLLVSVKRDSTHFETNNLKSIDSPGNQALRLCLQNSHKQTCLIVTMYIFLDYHLLVQFWADLSLLCDKDNQQNRKYQDWIRSAGSRTAGIKNKHLWLIFDGKWYF